MTRALVVIGDTMAEVVSHEQPSVGALLEKELAWVRAMAARYADPAREGEVGALLREYDVGQLLAALHHGFAKLLTGAPPVPNGATPPRPVRDASQLLVRWETFFREDRLRELAGVVCGLQWYAERTWRGCMPVPWLTGTSAHAKRGTLTFEGMPQAPATLGLLLVVATLHLHLLGRSYRLLCTDLGTLRTQANYYGRYLVEWFQAVRTSVGHPAAASGATHPERNADDVRSALDRIGAHLEALAQAWRQGRFEDSARQIYGRVLERPVDAMSLAVAVRALVKGTPERQVIRQVALSAVHRFFFVRGYSSSQAVEKFYDHLLARPCDPYELELGMDMMARGGIGALVDFLVDGNEYTQRFGDYKVPGDGRAGCYD